MEKIEFPAALKKESFFGIESDELIYIDICGRKLKKDQPEYTRRFKGRVDWQIIFIRDGYGYFDFDGTIQKVGPCSLVVFKPHEPQLYAYMPDECPVADYVHFSGTLADSLMKKYRLSGQKVYNLLPYSSSMLSEAFSMLTTQKKFFQEQHMSWGYFLDVLSKLSFSLIDSDSEKNILFNRYYAGLTKVIQDMQDNYHVNTPVESYAKMINLSPSRFAHVFKQIIGCSPINYKNTLRLESAKKILANTTANIEETAYQLGFSSVSQFTKSFKNHYGYTPSYYRKSISKPNLNKYT